MQEWCLDLAQQHALPIEIEGTAVNGRRQTADGRRRSGAAGALRAVNAASVQAA
jgi:hypothetical protein